MVCYKHIARCLCLVAAFCGQVVVRGGRMMGSDRWAEKFILG